MKTLNDMISYYEQETKYYLNLLEQFDFKETIGTSSMMFTSYLKYYVDARNNLLANLELKKILGKKK